MSGLGELGFAVVSVLSGAVREGALVGFTAVGAGAVRRAGARSSPAAVSNRRSLSLSRVGRGNVPFFEAASMRDNM